MVWVYPEYGGQVAVNFGTTKAVRTNLTGKRKPSDWEIFDLASDPNETKNLATERPDLLSKAKAVLKSQAVDNPLFPVDMAKTGSPIAVGHKAFGVVFAIGKGGANWKLPVALEFRDAVFGAAALIAAPDEIGREIGGHVHFIGGQTVLHPLDGGEGFGGAGGVVGHAASFAANCAARRPVMIAGVVVLAEVIAGIGPGAALVSTAGPPAATAQPAPTTIRSYVSVAAMRQSR